MNKNISVPDIDYVLVSWYLNIAVSADDFEDITDGIYDNSH